MVLLIICSANSCVEEVAVETVVESSVFVDDILVVDATLTDELKNHQVQLSRIFRLEEEEPVFETGAQVLVIDNLGTEISYQESVSGYVYFFDSLCRRAW